MIEDKDGCFTDHEDGNMSRSRWICWVAAALVVAVAAAGVVAVDKVDVTYAGRYNTTGDADGVFVSGNYAYVADGINGIAILCSDMSGIDTTSTPSVRILGLSSSVRGGEGWLEQYPR